MKRFAFNRFLAEMVDSHGGVRRWHDLKGLSSTIVAGGHLWDRKGIEIPPVPLVVTTDFHRQWASFTPFGHPEWTMTWTPQRVAVENRSRRLIIERDNPRAAFDGHGFDTPWDPLHLAYFSGYAMWACHTLPFVLAEPGFEITEAAPILDDGKMLRGISARFPRDVHSHCQEQRFYIDDRGLLVRHEYGVDVLGGSRAIHLLSDYVNVDGLILPTRRSVHAADVVGSVGYRVEIITISQSEYLLR